MSGCGGGGAPEPRTAENADNEDVSPASAEEDASTDDSEATASAAPKDPCADGSCFSCGKSMCLPGWYCDEGAKGGAACSWLPECATSPSCKCITKVLGAACSCKDDGGGPHVTCE